MVKIWYDIAGIIGVMFILFAYFSVQSHRLKYNDMAYPVINLIGSLLILGSLYITPNLPSIIIECAWIGISIYGIRVAYKAKHSRGNGDA